MTIVLFVTIALRHSMIYTYVFFLCLLKIMVSALVTHFQKKTNTGLSHTWKPGDFKLTSRSWRIGPKMSGNLLENMTKAREDKNRNRLHDIVLLTGYR